jgi:hypothetical protein
MLVVVAAAVNIIWAAQAPQALAVLVVAAMAA